MPRLTGPQAAGAINARVPDQHKVSTSQAEALLALLVDDFNFAVQLFGHLLGLHGLANLQGALTPPAPPPHPAPPPPPAPPPNPPPAGH